MSLKYTHFIVTDDHQVRLFNIESCETCGSDIEEPNALHARVDPHVLDQLGLTEVFEPLCEGWHDNRTGKQVCENCPKPDEQQERLRKAWALILANGPCRHEETRVSGFGTECVQCRRHWATRAEFDDAMEFLKRYDEAVDLVSEHLPDLNHRGA